MRIVVLRTSALALSLLSTTAAFAEDADPSHDKFPILELKVGMPLAQPGFACTKGDENYAPECVKFIDPRCKGPGTIGAKPYGSTGPKGCFLEQRSFATFLNGRLMVQSSEVRNGNGKPDPDRYPLINLHLYGTRSKPSKIARIVYTMAVDDLASGDKPSESKLYKALVAKYGEPKQIWSGKVKWSALQTNLEAYCDVGQCWLDVEDRAFADAEEKEQEERDAEARQKKAPEPKL